MRRATKKTCQFFFCSAFQNDHQHHTFDRLIELQPPLSAKADDRVPYAKWAWAAVCDFFNFHLSHCQFALARRNAKRLLWNLELENMKLIAFAEIYICSYACSQSWWFCVLKNQFSANYNCQNVRTLEFQESIWIFHKTAKESRKESHKVALSARLALVELEFMFLFRYVSLNSFKFHKIIANLRVCKSTTREVNLKFLVNLRLLLLVSRFRFTTRKICRDSRQKFTAETEVARGDVELLIDSTKGSVDRRKFAGPVQVGYGNSIWIDQK